MVTLVLGMGNPILSDDGAGLRVAERLAQGPLPPGVVVRQSEVGGLRLLDLVRGFTKVYVIDALTSGRTPGEVVRYTADDFKGGYRYSSAHSMRLNTVLELGRRLGYQMPEELTVYAIEASDVETFSEELSPPVAAAVERVVEMLRCELSEEAGEVAVTADHGAGELGQVPGMSGGEATTSGEVAEASSAGDAGS